MSAGVIVFKNGDRITGDIKSIYDGDVLVEPEYADEFSVDQDEISHIESKKRFDLEYRGEDMVTHSAIFKGADAQGNQIVELDGKEVTISIMEIGELDEEEEFFDMNTQTHGLPVRSAVMRPTISRVWISESLASNCVLDGGAYGLARPADANRWFTCFTARFIFQRVGASTTISSMKRT